MGLKFSVNIPQGDVLVGQSKACTKKSFLACLVFHTSIQTQPIARSFQHYEKISNVVYCVVRSANFERFAVNNSFGNATIAVIGRDATSQRLDFSPRVENVENPWLPVSGRSATEGWGIKSDSWV